MLYHSGPASSITTLAPAFVSMYAAIPPPAPLPTMQTSYTGRCRRSGVPRRRAAVRVVSVAVIAGGMQTCIDSAACSFDFGGGAAEHSADERSYHACRAQATPVTPPDTTNAITSALSS